MKGIDQKERERLSRVAFQLASDIRRFQVEVAALSDDYECCECGCRRRSDPPAFTASTCARRAYKALIRAQQLLDGIPARRDDDDDED